MPNPQFPLTIALSGFPGAGKDTVAAILNLLGYAPLSFASQLRQEIYDIATSILGEELTLHYPSAATGAGAAISDCPDPDVRKGYSLVLANPQSIWAKPTSHPIRKLLQWWGTDFRRSQDPNYWTTQFLTQTYPQAQLVLSKHFAHYFPTTRLSHSLPIVLTDTRFDNELDMAKELTPGQFQHWRILREGSCDRSVTNHASEQEHPRWPVDHTIHNNGTLLDLNQRVLNALYGPGQIPAPPLWKQYHRENAMLGILSSNQPIFDPPKGK